MLIFGLDIPVWVTLFLGICVLLYWYGTSTFGTFKKLGIPYRTPLIPFFGNLLHMQSKSTPEYDMEQRTLFPGKVCGSFRGRQPLLEIADAQLYHQITNKNFEKFRNRIDMLPGESMTHSIVFAIDDHWKHMRTILSPTFTSGKLKLMFDVICNRADKLVSRMRKSAGAPVTIKDYAIGYTGDVIATTAFGLDIDTASAKDHPFVVNAGSFAGLRLQPGWKNTVKKYFNLLVIVVFPSFMTDVLRFFGFTILDPKIVEYFEAILGTLLAEKKSEETSQVVSSGKSMKNFISMMAERLVDLKDVDKSTLRVSADGYDWSTAGLTKADILCNAVSFIIAGYDTTASSIQFFCYNMAMNPDVQEKLRKAILEVDADGNLDYEQIQNLDYLDWCVNESLRIIPPVVRIDRVCNEDCAIAGVNMTKGMNVTALIFAIHRDPDYWPEPEIFKPERFAPENFSDSHRWAFMPFGAGNRMCIASRLGLLEIKTAMVKLLVAFKFEPTLETPKLADLTFSNRGQIMQSTEPVKLFANPRNM